MSDIPTKDDALFQFCHRYGLDDSKYTELRAIMELPKPAPDNPDRQALANEILEYRAALTELVEDRHNHGISTEKLVSLNNKLLRAADSYAESLAREREVAARIDELGVVQGMLHGPKDYDQMSTVEATTWVILQAGKLGTYCDERLAELQAKQEAKE
jgi:hypothetical protein